MYLKSKLTLRQRLTAKLVTRIVLSSDVPASVMATHVTLQMSPWHFAQVFLAESRLLLHQTTSWLIASLNSKVSVLHLAAQTLQLMMAACSWRQEPARH